MNDVDNRNELKSIDFASVPLTIPIVSESETMEQFRERWSKVDNLKPENKVILSSNETIEQIKFIQKNFNLAYEETCNISRLVRSLVFGEIAINQIEIFLQQKISRIDKNNIAKIKDIIDKILSQKPILETEQGYQNYVVELPISKALEQYPELGEQGITVNPLKLKYFEMPMRPSIKNWITDFHDNMGAGKHGAIDRGNYLYHGENGKKLTPFERQKLSSILKSLDENSPITVDPEKKVVVFENNKTSITSDQQSSSSKQQPATSDQQPSGSKQQPVISQKDVFERYTPALQKSVRKPITKAELENDNYFGNFRGNAAKQVSLPAHVPDPFSIAARKREIDAAPNKNKNISALSGNISFSSAQTFSNEKKARKDSQWHIKPAKSFSNEDDVEDKLSQSLKNSSNVVNLKN